jgi:branched-chain amino acid transport system substrate-binding protein
MKKNIQTILVVVVVLVIVLVSVFTNNNDSRQFTIGAILPLSGGAAIWGENVKNGMDLALINHPDIKVIYQDSKGTPADGVSAFRLLKDQKTNITVSILSAVSVTLSKLALEEKTPLFVTLTAADNIANDYTVRYYNDSSNFAGPSFSDPSSPLSKVQKIAVLYRNDDLGKSVLKQIQNLAVENKKEIVFSDSFNPGETNFSTLLLKVKSTKAEALMFVPVTPGEAVGIVKMADQLKIGIPLIEASNVFADMSNRSQVTGLTFYSNIYDFSLPENGLEFKKLYREKYGKEPNFGAAYGYDIINTLAKCQTKTDVLTFLKAIKQIDGIIGHASQIRPGDFNVPLNFNKVN